MPEKIPPETTIAPFWERKTLAQLSQQEWESLCDGCAKCCLVKLQNEDTDKTYITNVACKLLDIDSCRCGDYPHRAERVSMCMLLSADKIESFEYLPQSCAYRCLHEGRPLPSWHPLITGNKTMVHEGGHSIQAYALSEEFIHPEQLEDHITSELI